MSWITSTRVLEKGLLLITASCARRTLAAATSFMASVIFWVVFMESILWRSCRSLQRTEGGEYRKELFGGEMQGSKRNGFW